MRGEGQLEQVEKWDNLADSTLTTFHFLIFILIFFYNSIFVLENF
jgi:hypothetical protein